jgi:hypothetical protein
MKEHRKKSYWRGHGVKTKQVQYVQVQVPLVHCSIFNNKNKYFVCKVHI